MQPIAKLISLAALAAVVVPCLLFLGGMIELEVVKRAALAGTIVWFVATPLWMGRSLPVDADQVAI